MTDLRDEHGQMLDRAEADAITVFSPPHDERSEAIKSALEQYYYYTTSTPIKGLTVEILDSLLGLYEQSRFGGDPGETLRLHAKQFIDLGKAITAHTDRIAALEAENATKDEALTPSEDTKANYIGEFSFSAPGGDVVQVPWTTIKQIMAVIRARATRTIVARAALAPKETGK